MAQIVMLIAVAVLFNSICHCVYIPKNKAEPLNGLDAYNSVTFQWQYIETMGNTYEIIERICRKS